MRTHWGVDDPALATGSDAEIDAAFDQAYRTLRTRIEALLALPLEPDWKPAVRANLEVTLKLAAIVGEKELPDDAEPAPVYKA